MKTKMRKSIIILIGGILWLTVGCRPVNPPQSDEDVVKIIKILYNSLGNPASVCLEPLTEMGFKVPYYLPDSRSGYDEGYYIKTDDYEFSIACNHDSVTLARYGYKFRSTYVDGVKEFHIADDVVYDFGWEQWIGGYNSDYRDLSYHDAANVEIDSCVAANKTSHCFVLSTYQKAFDNKYLLSSVHYWAVSIGGMNPNTGEALNSMADCQISIEFDIHDSPNSSFE